MVTALVLLGAVLASSVIDLLLLLGAFWRPSAPIPAPTQTLRTPPAAVAEIDRASWPIWTRDQMRGRS